MEYMAHMPAATKQRPHIPFPTKPLPAKLTNYGHEGIDKDSFPKQQ